MLLCNTFIPVNVNSHRYDIFITQLSDELGAARRGSTAPCMSVLTSRVKAIALKVFVTAQVLHHKNCYKQEVATEKKALHWRPPSL